MKKSKNSNNIGSKFGIYNIIFYFYFMKMYELINYDLILKLFLINIIFFMLINIKKLNILKYII